jgi:ribosome-interacting GTPase 1
MAANLTPQYLKAEEQYRRATTTEDELKALEVMLREMPKHKASEKLQSDLKQKISRAKKEIEAQKKSGPKAHSVRIPRQGAGTAILLGGPNAGKSQLLASLTRALPVVADYPFSTHAPLPGMMPYEDVMVQLIDTPPITSEFLEPYVQGLVRAADAAVLLLDLANDEGPELCQQVIGRLAATKTRLARTSSLDEEDVGLSFTQTLLAANKIDAPDALLRLELFHESCPVDFPEYVISAKEGTGLAELAAAVYRSLDVIRVYTKLPKAKEADWERPFTLRRGSTLAEMAVLVHKDFADQLKFARVWGSQVHDATVAKGDYVLHDKDVVELHV